MITGHSSVGGEIESGVRVPFRRRSVAVVANHHSARSFERVRRPHGLRHLRPQRTRDCDEVEFAAAVVDRHLPPLAQIVDVAVALVDELLGGEAPPHEHPGFAVLPEDHVGGGERGGAAYVHGLLAVVGHVEGDAALTLRLVQDLVHGVQHAHVFVHLEEGLGGEVGFSRGSMMAPLRSITR
jgi:hypothetical protein